MPSPKHDEVLIGIRAAAVTAGDCELRGFALPLWIGVPLRAYLGVRRPSRRPVPGSYFAGRIEAVGRDVTRFAVGDRVFGAAGLRFGAYAEYLCLPETAALATLPAGVDYREAAALPLGGLNALHFLGRAAVEPGERVLVNGAAGSIGSYAVQFARHLGAEVTAVDSGAKLAYLRRIGADRVIDYTREDFTRGDRRYDVILDVIAASSLTRRVAALAPGGRYLLANPTPTTMLQGAWISRTSDRTVVLEAASETATALERLREHCEAGIVRAIIDRSYPLEQAAAAHRYQESGQKMGDVVLTVTGEDGGDDGTPAATK